MAGLAGLPIHGPDWPLGITNHTMLMTPSPEYKNFTGEYEKTVKEADYTFVPYIGPDWTKKAKYPSVVVESGWSEAADQLKRDATHWQTGSGGHVRVVIQAKFYTREEKRIGARLWLKRAKPGGVSSVGCYEVFPKDDAPDERPPPSITFEEFFAGDCPPGIDPEGEWCQCNVSRAWAEGTAGFWVTDREFNLYLVTARHVLFPAGPGGNAEYQYRQCSQPRMKVALFGEEAFGRYVNQIDRAIAIEMQICESNMKLAQRRPPSGPGIGEPEPIEVRNLANTGLSEAHVMITDFHHLRNEVVGGWSSIADRVIGYVEFAPSIAVNVGHLMYTEDYALIRIDKSKIDASNFTGNTIDLGTKIAQHDFKAMMFPNWANTHDFEYPSDRLFKVRGVTPYHELTDPPILDQARDRCLVVMKCGNTTGLTIGRANEISSRVPNYFDGVTSATSCEWTILPYDNKSGPFSAPGDSGSGIVDCLGRLGGLLTSGSGLTDSTDITYATPVPLILRSLQNFGYNVTVMATLSAVV